MKEQLKNVKHDYIRYANCWEDADVLLNALMIQQTDRVLSIASAGDNSFSLLSQSPELVVAVDVNPIQLHLVELKKAAFKALKHDEFLTFLGFEDGLNRVETYKKVREHLSEKGQLFWNDRLNEIEEGVIYVGKFERYFKLFYTRILPLIHTKKRIKKLFEQKTEEEQLAFFNLKWNNLRWRLLFKLFFSKFVMGKFGRDPAFLKEVEVPVSEFIIEKAKAHLTTIQAQKNYFLYFIMKGNFGDNLPHYARKENFNAIKKNIDALVIFEGLAEQAFDKYQGFNKFNLSNIFEYMAPSLFKSVTANLVENGSGRARYVYWNLMVPRKMHVASKKVLSEENKAQELREKDNGFFYAGINIDIKK